VGRQAADELPTQSQGGIGELQMRDSVFVDVEFFLLMLFSIVLPVGMYGYMMWRRAISRKTVLLFGFMLVAKSGVTVFILQRLAEMARASPSSLDNVIFASQFSGVLYFVPMLFAGIGVNMLSQVMMNHLADAERRFDRERTENIFAMRPMERSVGLDAGDQAE